MVQSLCPPFPSLPISKIGDGWRNMITMTDKLKLCVVETEGCHLKLLDHNLVKWVTVYSVAIIIPKDILFMVIVEMSSQTCGWPKVLWKENLCCLTGFNFELLYYLSKKRTLNCSIEWSGLWWSVGNTKTLYGVRETFWFDPSWSFLRFHSNSSSCYLNIIKGKLHFSTLNYTPFYTLPLEPSKCTIDPPKL